jgi:hypothetical protein
MVGILRKHRRNEDGKKEILPADGKSHSPSVYSNDRFFSGARQDEDERANTGVRLASTAIKDQTKAGLGKTRFALFLDATPCVILWHCSYPVAFTLINPYSIPT